MGIYPKKCKTLIWQYIYISMLIVTLFMIAKIWSNVSIDRQLDREDVVHIYNGVLDIKTEIS